jgi:hypothetical protein
MPDWRHWAGTSSVQTETMCVILYWFRERELFAMSRLPGEARQDLRAACGCTCDALCEVDSLDDHIDAAPGGHVDEVAGVLKKRL